MATDKNQVTLVLYDETIDEIVLWWRGPTGLPLYEDYVGKNRVQSAVSLGRDLEYYIDDDWLNPLVLIGEL